MRLGILTILSATILVADAQIAATLQIAGTSSNQVVVSWLSGVPSLATFQETTALANPIHWSNDFTGWINLNGSFVHPATGSQGFYRIVQSIPVFELAVFYNLDLEINPGKTMVFNGLVHGNGNIYVTGTSVSSPLRFLSTVEAVQQVNLFASPLDPRNVSRNGNVIFSNTTNNPINHAGMLYLGIGATNNPATILGLPPAGIDPASPTGQSYIYNLADIIISNSAVGQFSVYYQNLYYLNPQTLIPYDITNIVSHTTNTFYSFVTNVTFYDYREAKNVKAVQLDVSKFGQWLTNSVSGLNYQNLNLTGSTSKGHGLDVVYIYNGIPNASSQLPAVRVVNGAKLPSLFGLTVASQFPLYVFGNYNTTTNGVDFSTTMGDTTNTYPAALMGDAITVLSANWSDSSTAATSLPGRTPVSTTINAATLQGIVPSNGSYYSGGLENFLRLQENWDSGSPLTYNGSIAVLFSSQYATNSWNSAYYGVPTRLWGFDPNFQNSGKLPPATPMVVNQASP